jgi:hypothetical protein
MMIVAGACIAGARALAAAALVAALQPECEQVAEEARHLIR